VLYSGLDELASEGVLSKDARPGGEKIVWSTVHGASSLAIEGWMSPSDFPMVWRLTLFVTDNNFLRAILSSECSFMRITVMSGL
jgi:hypothetical protein